MITAADIRDTAMILADNGAGVSVAQMNLLRWGVAIKEKHSDYHYYCEKQKKYGK